MRAHALRKPKQRELLPSEWPEWPEVEVHERPQAEGPEDLFARQLGPFKLNVVRQLRFAKAAMGRQWRFDLALPDYMLAIEIQGVVVRKIGGRVVTMGGHADVQGMRDDHEKFNAATLLGWSVLFFMPADVKPRRALETTLRVLAARGWRNEP